MDKTYGRKNAAFPKVCDTCYIRYTKNGVHLPFLEKPLTKFIILY